MSVIGSGDRAVNYKKFLPSKSLHPSGVMDSKQVTI